jgi:hypothetical protein
MIGIAVGEGLTVGGGKEVGWMVGVEEGVVVGLSLAGGGTIAVGWTGRVAVSGGIVVAVGRITSTVSSGG